MELSTQPSLEAVENAQMRVLEDLLREYAETSYGASRGASEISSLEDYRRRFPVVSYRDLEPYIERILWGEWRSLLSEPPSRFGATSGTRGVPKLIPLTPSDIEDRLRVMARGLRIVEERIGTGLGEACLSIYFPSRVLDIDVGGRLVPCGYISGIHAAILEERGFPIKPPVREMDAIGDGVGRRDWEQRFKLVYEYLRGVEVGFAVGSAYAMYMFGKYLEERLKLPPRDVWSISLMLCAGEPHIPDYSRDLRKLYGRDLVVVEAYGATEGMFAMQLGKKPYLTPFYDAYLFEIRVGGRVKMLYEMEEGEVGSLIISTRVLPRYEIGDLVKCYVKGTLFRVVGRDRALWRLLTRAWRMFELTLSLL